MTVHVNIKVIIDVIDFRDLRQQFCQYTAMSKAIFLFGLYRERLPTPMLSFTTPPLYITVIYSINTI